MKKILVSLLLILALCLPTLVACGNNDGTTLETTDTEAETTPTYVMDHTVVNRVYSFYSESFGVIGTEFNRDGLPLSIKVYDYDLSSEAEYYSFCDMEYDSTGKLTAVVCEDSIFGFSDIRYAISEYDEQSRPLTADGGENVYLEFTYDDTASTVTMACVILNETEKVTEEAVTFDKHGRSILVKDNYGDECKTVYDGNVAKYTETGYDEGEYNLMTYDDNACLEKLEWFEDGESRGSYSFTYDERGLCTEAVYDDGEDKRRNEYAYDDRNNFIKHTEISVDYTTGAEEKDIETVYVYNDNNKITTKTVTGYDSDGSSYTSRLCTYEYGTDGNLTKESKVSYTDKGTKMESEYTTVFSADGEVNTSVQYRDGVICDKDVSEYNAEGQTVKYTRLGYNDNGEENYSCVSEYTYADNGEYTVASVIYSDGKLYSKTITDFYRNGNRKKEVEIHYSSNGEESSKITTNYDENGNVINN